MSAIKHKRILITGIDGFIGSHLAAKLTSLGADVYGISRTQRGPHILTTDITHRAAVAAFIHTKRIEACIHLAGISVVEAGQHQPYHTFKTNILSTLNLLEIARTAKLERLIVTSTTHVYGNATPPFHEEHSPLPSRPYETSKTCTDLIAQSYANTFQLPVLIPRFVNVYGPGDRHTDRLIPRFMKRVIEEKPIQVWGGSTIRSYLYIDDVVAAYLALLEYDVFELTRNRIYNFGSDERVSVLTLAKKIQLLGNKKTTIEEITNQRDDEVLEQYVSWAKAKHALGWQQTISLDHGLRKTFLWYKRTHSI